MASMLLGILIILIINKQSSSYNYGNEIDYKNTKNLYDCVNYLYEVGEYDGRECKNELSGNNNSEEFKELIRNDLEELSTQLMNFDSNPYGNPIYNEEEVISVNLDLNLQDIKDKLVKYISNIEYWFDKAKEYKLNNGYSEETLKSFVKLVLWDENNVKSTLFEMYGLLSSAGGIDEGNYLSVIFKNIQLERSDDFCDELISEQQEVYYIFMSFIRTIFKAFATITRAYFVQSVLDEANFVKEYTMFKQTFNEKLNNFIEDSIRYILTLPAKIQRCNIYNPKMGNNVLEMEGLFQVLVNYEYSIKKAVTHRRSFIAGGCEDIKIDKRQKFTLYNCKSYSAIRGCPTFQLSSNPRTIRFLWFTADSETFGHSQKCNNSIYEIDRYLSISLYYNDVCVCSVNFTNASNFPDYSDAIKINEPKVMKILLEPQLSDIKNNWIVVGVKFILHDDAIHLQIQQSEISKGGSVNLKAPWKSVNVDNNNETINITYGVLFDERNILYLDDVMAHPDYVVTGVKFQITEDGSGFELHIHATDYDYSTGLLGEDQKWYRPGEYPLNPLDYQRQRTEIKLNDPDDPTLAQNYQSDLDSNKFIQFQHSSIKKDAGYHTVPFFDANPVEVFPGFPLSGVGLFHRGLEGFGGYIAPRLHSHNISRVIEKSFDKPLDLIEPNLSPV
ncbi:hypothetical protein PV327_009022 [Microctonus hyperodae]|uniref:Uncharacterized protein n=1 Tax=Microctonus hyperodae TaxID=165561 RepID=A0AA39FSX6_MICHY|nr:hypothetical protein PV327_009022 [Microctonus hyperodae]